MFSYTHFIVLTLVLGSLLHCELNFVYSMCEQDFSVLPGPAAALKIITQGLNINYKPIGQAYY